MKRIKTFNRFVSESLTSLETSQLETILTKWQKEHFSGHGETDPYLTFEIGLYDGIIEYGYTGFEDSDNTYIKLNFLEDKIEAIISQEGYNTETGEHDSDTTKNFENIDELIEYLKVEMDIA